MSSDIFITHVRGAIAASRHRAPVRPTEEPAILIVLLYTKRAFVHQGVVIRAKEHQVAEASLTACGPVFDVVRINEVPPPATGKAASLVARPQRPFDCLRHHPTLASDAQWLTLRVLDKEHATRIAANAPHGFDW
jgi:hypothetical protein